MRVLSLVRGVACGIDAASVGVWNAGAIVVVRFATVAFCGVLFFISIIKCG